MKNSVMPEHLNLTRKDLKGELIRTKDKMVYCSNNSGFEEESASANATFVTYVNEANELKEKKTALSETNRTSGKAEKSKWPFTRIIESLVLFKQIKHRIYKRNYKLSTIIAWLQDKDFVAHSYKNNIPAFKLRSIENGVIHFYVNGKSDHRDIKSFYEMLNRIIDENK